MFDIFTSQCSFQRKHWFDKHITLRYLKWLKSYYAREIAQGEVVGFLWDHAPAHTTPLVEEWLKSNEDWLVVMMIPGGLTSILQPCDLVVNRELKRRIKSWYGEWRLAELEKLGALGDSGHVKLKMPRGDIMTAMVEIIAQLNQNSVEMNAIAECFEKCGFALTLDVPDEPLEEDDEVWMSQLPKFNAWIASLTEKSLYKHLLASLNQSGDAEEGESIVDDLAAADIELELGQIEVNDAHLADALAGLSDDEFQ